MFSFLNTWSDFLTVAVVPALLATPSAALGDLASSSFSLRECFAHALTVGWEALDESASNELLNFALARVPNPRRRQMGHVECPESELAI